MLATPENKLSSPARYRAGTLTYTKAGLVLLFGYLLWGDFCFTLMEQVVPNLLPILLEAQGATNSQIAILVSTVAAVFNALITPTVSYLSDRHRGPRGRRIPFLLWPTPLIVLTLALLPFGPDLAGMIGKIPSVKSFFGTSPASLAIIVIGVLTVAYQMVNMVVASIYFYLFNDVVPGHFLGRFFALFRVVGTLGGFFFNYFIFGLAETHMKEIFAGLALLYGTAFALMCWKVREGEYPPIQDEPRGSLKSALHNYFTQSFSLPIYRWLYLAYATFVWSNASVIFWVFFLRDDIGLSLDTIGKYRSWASLFVIVLAYPFGVLVDRWKSQRVLLLGTAALAISNLACFFFIRDARSYLICVSLLIVSGFLIAISNAVWFPDLLPKSRYGQFASAAALVSSLAMIGISPLCGWILDRIGDYRFVFLWSATLLSLSCFCLFKVHHYWTAFGGPDNYVAPEPPSSPPPTP